LAHDVKSVSRKACTNCAKELRGAQIRGLKAAERVLCRGCRKARNTRRRLAAGGS